MHIYIWSHIKIYLTGLVAAEAVPVHFLKISEHSLSRCNYDLYGYNISFVSAVVVFPGNFDFDIWGITSLFSPSTTIYGNNWSCEKIIRNNRLI